MEKTIISWLSENDFRTIVQSIESNYPAHFHEAFFPSRTTPDLKWETVLKTNDDIQAAPVIAFNSSSPELSRKAAEVLRGDINPISVKRYLNEKLIIQINNPAFNQEIYRHIFDDITDIQRSIKNRLDFMAMQMLSSGQIVLDANTNSGGQVLTLDFGLESWQKNVVTTVWSNAASTPVADIRGWVSTLYDKGIIPSTIWMPRAVFNNMIKTTEFTTTFGIKVTKGSTTGGIVGVQDVNNLFLGADLPAIAIVEDAINYQKIDGSLDVTRRAWKSNTIAFMDNSVQGSLLYAPTAEEIIANKDYYFTKLNNISMQKYSLKDPIKEVTLGKANAFPVWNRPNRILLANVASTTTF